MDVVKYNLETNSIEDNNEDMILSDYIPSHLKELIKTLSDDLYILGVQYDVMNDIQPCITGSSQIKENWKRTITRELAEELKLYPKYKMIEHSKEYVEELDQKKWFCCMINLDNTESSINQEFKQEFKVRAWGKKVGILVYGRFEKMLKLLKTNYEKYLPNDNISHIVMVNVGFLKSKL